MRELCGKNVHLPSILVHSIKKNHLMRKKNKSFKDWQYEEVEQAFGLTRLRTLPILEELKQKMGDGVNTKKKG